MNNTNVHAGDHEAIATNIGLTSKSDIGDSTISLNAMGMGPLTGTGNVEIAANGKVSAQAGNAIVQLSSDVTQQSSVVIDGGLLGNVTLANAAPVGTAQTVELDGLLGSIEISNGNIPGASQSIKMDALEQSLELSAGNLPISPCISMGPAGITLSYGPANSINIGPAGITIQGLLVDIEGEVEATVGGPFVVVESDAITDITGGVVMIQ